MWSPGDTWVDLSEKKEGEVEAEESVGESYV